jgi:hypothetical protein
LKRKRLVITVIILICVAIAAVPYALYMNLDEYEWQGAYLVNTQTGVRYLSNPELNRSEALDKLSQTKTIGRVKGDNFFGFKTWIKSIEGIEASKMIYLQGLMYSEVLVAADKAGVPSDFGFALKYGVGARNIVDTYKGTYQKDLVSAGTVKTKLTFTPEEITQIYDKMLEIEIMSYPESFEPPYAEHYKADMVRIVEPHMTYDLHVTFAGQTKDITWNDTNTSKLKKAEELRELYQYIDELIRHKEAYYKLPNAVGGYD